MSFVQELEAIRDGVGLFDADSYGQIRISGPDAPAFLHRMTSNEVLKRPVGEGFYNAILDRKGMVRSLFYMIRSAEAEFLLITPPQLREKTCKILTMMKLAEKVTVEDQSADRRLVMLVGPGSEKDQKVPGTFWSWTENTFGVPVVNLSGPVEEMERWKREVTATPLSPEAIKLLQIKAGFPEYGVDIDESHILLEARLPYTYQRQKGCYPGQEVVERILTYGKGRTPKSLCRLTAEGEQTIAPKTEIFSNPGEKAGHITSELFDPLENKTFLLAYLDHKFVDGASHVRKQEDRLILA